MITINESDMEFGTFQKEKVFRMEDSRLQHSFGEGVKTVEFVLLKDRDKLLFVEAKKSCPNRDNRYENKGKTEKFEGYFSDISDKFVDSLQMMLNIFLDRRTVNLDEVGSHITDEKIYSILKFRFVLVVKNAVDIAWLAGPKEELEARLLRWKKLWNIEVIVLNEELAVRYGIVLKK